MIVEFVLVKFNYLEQKMRFVTYLTAIASSLLLAQSSASQSEIFLDTSAQLELEK